jgi:hypothetical protein
MKEKENPLRFPSSNFFFFSSWAGSEKVKESKATGDVFTETTNINQSLLTLGKCISALADPKKRNGHIPFRDSKLTKLLKDSLGGQCLALMVECFSFFFLVCVSWAEPIEWGGS